MKKQILKVAAAVALVLGTAGTASALTLGTISTAGNNSGVDDIYGTPNTPTSRQGYFGANWYLVGGPATIFVSYLGSEAGFKNKFSFIGAPGDLITAGNTNAFSIPGIPTYSIANVASGLLKFSFTSQDHGPVFNGFNKDDILLGVGAGVNFFSSIVACPTCKSGVALDLWLDDFGAGNDDNHDDMVIRLSLDGGRFVVPIPAALPLLLSGLAGLGFIGRRRRVVPA